MNNETEQAVMQQHTAMHSIKKTILPVVLIFIATAALYACKNNDKPAVQAAVTQQADSANAAHDTLQSQYNAARVQIDDLTTKSYHLDSLVTKKDAEIAQLKKKLNHLSRKNKVLAKKLKKDDNFIASIKNELNGKVKAFSDRLAALEADKNSLMNQLDSLTKQYTALKELGSVLHASNFRIEPLHLKHHGRKEKKTAKARKMDELRLYFDIDENRIAENGVKKLYLVIKDPDGKLLSNKGYSGGTIAAADGSSINYSLEKDISLVKNQPVKNVQADWRQAGEHKKGDYSVSIYNGGYKIGGGDVMLN